MKRTFLICALAALASCSSSKFPELNKSNYTLQRVRVLENNTISTLAIPKDLNVYHIGDSVWVVPISNAVYRLDSGAHAMKAVIEAL